MALPDRVHDSRSDSFQAKEWDLGGDRFIGWDFATLARYAIMESRISSRLFKFPVDKERPNRITSCAFSIFLPNPHEQSGVVRHTERGRQQFWSRTQIDPITETWSHDPTGRHEYYDAGYAIGLYSRVGLGSSTHPEKFLAWGHFPMLDLTQPATDRNIRHVIEEIGRRTDIKRFFIIRSSKHGMMLFSPEIVDEPHLLDFWNSAELMNHVEVSRGRGRKIDYTFDSRWHARSQQNHKERLGTPNRLQVGGILRLNEAPPLKPDRPKVVAASF